MQRPEQPQPPPGWYDNDQGTPWYWDGERWHEEEPRLRRATTIAIVVAATILVLVLLAVMGSVLQP